MNTSTDVVEAHCNMALRSQVFDALRRYEVSDDCFAAIASITHAALTKPDDTSNDVVEAIAAFVENWNGATADGHTGMIASEIRERFGRGSLAALTKPDDEGLTLLRESTRSIAEQLPSVTVAHLNHQPKMVPETDREMTVEKEAFYAGWEAALQSTNREEEIRADERERCAKIAETWDGPRTTASKLRGVIAQAIRNGETK